MRTQVDTTQRKKAAENIRMLSYSSVKVGKVQLCNDAIYSKELQLYNSLPPNVNFEWLRVVGSVPWDRSPGFRWWIWPVTGHLSRTGLPSWLGARAKKRPRHHRIQLASSQWTEAWLIIIKNVLRIRKAKMPGFRWAFLSFPPNI